MSAENRCPYNHYWSGWYCQKNAGHDGPCIANAGLRGEEWRLMDGKYAVYAWHQPEGEPTCNQTQCDNPNACQCSLASARTVEET